MLKNHISTTSARNLGIIDG